MDDKLTDELAIPLLVTIKKFFKRSNFKKVVLAYKNSLLISEEKFTGSMSKKLFLTSFKSLLSGELVKNGGTEVTKFLLLK
jgi:hypothetical protein